MNADLDGPESNPAILGDLARLWIERREPPLPDDVKLASALTHLESRARGVIALEANLARVQALAASSEPGKRTSDHARATAALARALYAAGRINFAQRVFHSAALIENINEERIYRGDGGPELTRISLEMARMRDEAGLADDEDWNLSQAPEAYRRLNDEYVAVCDRLLTATFRELGDEELARLHDENRDRYDEMRETGRRSVFHAQDAELALEDYLSYCESEAASALVGKAFGAATLYTASAIECRLLLHCIRHPDAARKARQSLPSDDRPKSANPKRWNLGELVTVAKAANWLRQVDGEVARHYVDVWADRVRGLRNLIHPAAQIRERPFAHLDASDYEDALAVYQVVSRQLADSASDKSDVGKGEIAAL